MKRIIAVVGDYYHPEENCREALRLALKGENADLRFVATDRLADALEESPDVVVLFKEDRIAPHEDGHARWMTEPVATAVTRYVEQGGGWLAWHSGLASYDPAGTYIRMLRGHFLHHPQTHQTVRYMPEGSAFGQTQAFEFPDEHYFVKCDESHTEVFLRSSSIDGESIAGWRHRVGQGRVCCLTPAHLPAGLTNPDFLRVLGGALQWCGQAVSD